MPVEDRFGKGCKGLARSIKIKISEEAYTDGFQNMHALCRGPGDAVFGFPESMDTDVGAKSN
ncbi:MAG: hypothetical protein ACLUR5_10060 [Eubacterium ventriosum]